MKSLVNPFAVVATLCALAAGCGEPAQQSLPQVTLQPVENCRVEVGCAATGAGISAVVKFAASPRPLQAFPVTLSIEEDNGITAVFATFSMQGMDMGLNRYRLVAAGSGVWQGDVTLPVCVSGRSDWLVTFELVSAQRQVMLTVPFVVSR